MLSILAALLAVTIAPNIADYFKSIPREQRAEVLARLSDEQIEELDKQTEGLLGFIPRVSPELSAPNHLAPLVRVIESTLECSRKVVVATPPQHGKTETCLHGLVWLLQREPTRRHAYVTYETDRAQKLSAKAQTIATNAGLVWSGTRKSWKIADGGSVFATGLDSGLTGEAVDGVMVVDDPVKDVVEANSATYRQRAEDWFNAVALTRIHPGASAIVIQTRWHPDDLAGRLIARGWEHITLPAISHEGKALWPEERPLPWLKSQREAIGEYAWAALYEQQPRPRGANVFGDVHLYDPGLLMPGRKVALGVDTAYSEHTYSDFSVGLVMAKWGDKFYVLEVDRAQIKAPAFKQRLDALKQRHSCTRSRWYTSTTESGLALMLGISPVLAKTDKFVRAQKYAAAWNAGRVVCPAGAPWLNDFVAEHVAFTGVDDLHDDQVDAGAAAFDELESPAPSYAGLPKIHVPRRF